MNKAILSFRVDKVLKNKFAQAAKARGCTGEQLLRDYMREFVLQQQDAANQEAWFCRQVEAGVESANAGRLLPSADVEAQFAARRAATRRRLCAFD